MPNPRLLVEGRDEQQALLALLRRTVPEVACRVPLAEGDEPVPSGAVLVEDQRGVRNLTRNLGDAVRFSEGASVGIVADRLAGASDIWLSLRGELSKLGVPPEDIRGDIPDSGLVTTSARYQTRIGVWLMPDNQAHEDLEAFLLNLVPGSGLRAHASDATDAAVGLGGGFRGQDRKKAVLHAWLAWQDEPGLRYGPAVARGYFDLDLAASFVAWFRRLYLPSDAPSAGDAPSPDPNVPQRTS